MVMADRKNLLEINEIYKSDKSIKHRYIQDYYENTFKNLRDDVKSLMEIGVYHGASLMLWHDYFPQATIYGVDIDIRCRSRFERKFKTSRVELIIGNSVESETYQHLKNSFDIIIDDGSHRGIKQLQTFDILFEKLNKKGLYIIEDVAPTEIKNLCDHFKNLNLQHRVIDLSTSKVPDSIITEIIKG